jgi:hypothetical protein
MRVFGVRAAVIWLAISAFLTVQEASAQPSRGRVTRAPAGRPRMARALQPTQSPSGPDIPSGPDEGFDQFMPPSEGGFETPPMDDEAMPEESAGPPAMGNGATARPAPPSALREAPVEEELYEPLVPDYDGRYEATMGVPPNDMSKGAITQYSGPRDWYADLSFVMYTRNRPQRTNFAYETVVSSGQTFFVPIFGTEDMGYSFEPGARITLGRGLWVDAKQRDHALELTYIGTHSWNENWIIDRAGGTPLISGFPINGPVTPFDQADRYTLETTSDMQSYELNYVIRRRLERDRLVYSPSGVWRREAYPGWRPAISFGARYLSFDDEFDYFSSTNSGTTIASGEYRIEDRNSLVGAQIKGELMYQTWRYSMGVRGGAAGCINFSEVNAFLTGQTTSTTVADISPRSLTLRNQDAAVIGELGLIMNYRLTDRLTVHAGYDMFWLGGLSLAPEQLTYNVNVIAQQKNTGFTMVQGGTLGFELSW